MTQPDATAQARQLAEKWRTRANAIIEDVNGGHAPIHEAVTAREWLQCADELESTLTAATAAQEAELQRLVNENDQLQAQLDGAFSARDYYAIVDQCAAQEAEIARLQDIIRSCGVDPAMPIPPLPHVDETVRLKAERDKAEQWGVKVARENVELKAERDRLREALTRYGEHRYDCHARPVTLAGPGATFTGVGPCNCGLAAALKEPR